MHLKSLTLRGFKSFAAATTLRFDPGITCVVGPNGSGKSNVVDAIAWVLGEQGARALRGTSMADVIFSGSPGRPALGRAEVVLTIDNADGALPIDHAEVSVGRLMYRSGESEYAINGQTCRLLDVQELLSDSGIGRELHVVVGQGQLDTVLAARPEDRRAFIEEAAGILKYRKRKEKALRRLEAMQGNLDRVTDLAGELQRQLGPLGRQADLARRAGLVQASLRDARLRLAADDLATLLRELADLAPESGLALSGGRESDAGPDPAPEDGAPDGAPGPGSRAAGREAGPAAKRQAALEQALHDLRRAESSLEQRLAHVAPALGAAQEAQARLAELRARFAGLSALAGERLHHLRSNPPVATQPSADPHELDAAASRATAAEEQLAVELAEQRALLVERIAQRGRLETELARAQQERASAARSAAAARESRVALAARVTSLRERNAVLTAERGRLEEELATAQARLAAATAAGAEAEEARRGCAARLATGQAQAQVCAERARLARQRLDEVERAERDAERDRAVLLARLEALEVHVVASDLEGLAAGLDGVLGPLARLLEVAPGFEAAVGVALGSLTEAVAVQGLEAAQHILDRAQRTGSGRVDVAVLPRRSPAQRGSSGSDVLADRDPGADPPPRTAGAGGPAANAGQRLIGEPPPGCRWLGDVVSLPGAPDWLHAALEGTVLAADLAGACRVVASGQVRTAVTREGYLISGQQARGGATGDGGALARHAAAQEAARQAHAAVEVAEHAHQLAEAARADAAAAQADAAARDAEVREQTAALGEVRARLAAAQARSRGAADEVERVRRAVASAQDAGNKAREELGRLEELLAAAEREAEGAATREGTDDVTEPGGGLAGLAERCAAARNDEVEARLAVRTLEERLTAASALAAGLRDRVRSERDRAGAEQARQRQRARDAEVASRVADLAAQADAQVAAALAEATRARAEAARLRDALSGELLAARDRSQEVASQLDEARAEASREELLVAQLRVRCEDLIARVGEQFALTPAELLAGYGPDQPVPAEDPDQPAGVFVRAEQQRRATAAERELAQLGAVNPLALEEYTALTERHAYLTAQLDDLRRTRRDLLGIVREVDERIHEVFAAAFADTAREFEEVFATLFPGGQGRLVLTDPNDLLVTGVEIEARPPGKRVRQLSLLSGGERSLTAIALLMAIFRARPSPFYILDEVEAALDDANLSRLLESLVALRERSQLIVVTHQKRTMEIADVLYGVSMRADGLSVVITQRLREVDAPAVGAAGFGR